MRYHLYIFLVLVSNPFLSWGQTGESLELDTMYSLPFPVQNVSIDQSGNIYLVSNKGVVVKYNSDGDSLLSYSPKKNAEVNLIEAGNGLKPFLFYKDFQEYLFLDQYLTATSFLSFYPEIIGYAEIASISTDNNLWVVDGSDFSLKKYNIESNILEVESPLEIILDHDDYRVDYIREYHNLLFLYDRSIGIFLFDNFGTLQKKYPLPGLDFLNFHEDHIYFIRDGFLTFMNIYNGSSYGIPLPHYETFDFVRRHNDNIYLFSKNEMKIYKITSGNGKK